MHIPETIKTYGLILLIIIGSFWFASRFIEPPPPSEITLAAGSKSGNYYKYALAYQEKLADEGIDVTILETNGSVENISLLNQQKADIAFIQSGLANTENAASLEGLASLYYEPLWVFTTFETSNTLDIQNLKNKTVSIGVDGSGTQAIALDLLSLNGIEQNVKALNLKTKDSLEALENQSIDAAFFVAKPSAEHIQNLLNSDFISAMNFDRAVSYTKQELYLSAVNLTPGVLDLQKNIPAEKISLISPVAQLVAHSDFNAALKTLLVRTAIDIHGNENSLIADKGDFPSTNYLDFSLAEEADHYFKNGPNVLQRFLPFWIADMINRMVVLLIPLVGVMLPLLKIASPTYRWRTRSKIYKWYKNLKRMEESVGKGEEDQENILAALDHIDAEVKKTHVPLSYADELYNLRLHIKMIRDNIKK